METLQVNRKKIEKLSTVLNNSRIKIFEYLVDEDTLVVYNNKFHIEKTIAGYMDYIDNKSKIHPEDREKIKQIYKEAKEATVEIREFGENGDIKHSVLEFTKIVNEDGKLTLIGSTRDITEQRKQEKKLKERARKDSLTAFRWVLKWAFESSSFTSSQASGLVIWLALVTPFHAPVCSSRWFGNVGLNAAAE